MAKEKKSKRRRIDMLFITATISTSLVLFLIGIIAFLLLSAGKMSNSLREEMTVEIVLKEDIGQQALTALQSKLDHSHYIKDCVYVSKENALKEMTAEMGVDPSEFLQYNPFYASFSLTFDAEYANRDSLNAILPSLRAAEGVREINYQRELLDAVNNNIAKVSAVLLVLAVLMALISTTLINNTIKLTIYAQRFILHSMKLVGAKWSFIRRPFIGRNIWIGIAAAVLASLMIWEGLKLGAKYEPGIVSLLSKEMLLPVFAVIFMTGLLITWGCALHSVNRFLRMKSGELYYV